MATKTRTTLVAVFRKASEADATATELQAVGVHRDRILVASANATNTYQSGTGIAYEEEGGVKGWWHSMFGNDTENAHDRDNYEKAVNQGNVILSVDTLDQDENRIVDIINRHSPLDIQEEDSKTTTRTATEKPISEKTALRESAATATTADRTRVAANPPTGTSRGTAGAQAGNQQSVPVIEEDLKVEKRRVLRGGVRVYSRVVEQPVEENVNLREEHVTVNRQRVDRPAAAGTNLHMGQEKVFEVQEFAEVPVVTKEARVVEEIRVGKETTERTQKVSGKVRRTEVDVQPIEATTTAEKTNSPASRQYDQETDAAFRRDYETNYRSTGQPYDYYAGAYGFGYNMAADPRYQNRRFEDVESDLKTEYARRYPNSAWDRMKDSVRYGWHRLTHKTA
ncbi:MAG: YsnF/AvaK domain-containing protein [Bryobacteraceae bacterium]